MEGTQATAMFLGGVFVFMAVDATVEKRCLADSFQWRLQG